jgi:hypothetical protein
VYLQGELASCVDHTNQEEERNFQLLPAQVFLQVITRVEFGSESDP